MKNIKDYVNELFMDLPDSEEKESIKEEIIENLEEKVQDLVYMGKNEEDAINKAIVDFGDIDDIKKELMEKHPSKKNKYAIYLGYSIWGSISIIALVIFMNFYYSPETIWFVYPTFVILWWPATMFYVYKSKK